MMKTWFVRIGLLLVLLAAHVEVWRPFRVMVTTRLVQPVLAPEAGIQSSGVSFTLTRGENSSNVKIPGGIFLLFPCIIFLLIGRYRPIGWLWLGHLAGGLVSFGCFWAGVHMAPWLLYMGGFINSYLIRAASMGYLVLVWVSHYRVSGPVGLKENTSPATKG